MPFQLFPFPLISHRSILLWEKILLLLLKRICSSLQSISKFFLCFDWFSWTAKIRLGKKVLADLNSNLISQPSAVGLLITNDYQPRLSQPNPGSLPNSLNPGIYIALSYVLLYTQNALQSSGSLPPTTTSVQHSLRWCDSSHRTMAPLLSTHQL